MTRAVFVSDVHLRPDAPEKERRFFRFLDAVGETPVYILGDLFDYWIGARHFGRDDFRSALAGLRRAGGSGRLNFVPGNRDFLLDGRFARLTGVRLLGPQVRRTFDGHRVLLAHGDFIFNRNSKYFLYRRLMRWRFLTDSLQLLPGAVAVRLVRGYKRVSVATTPTVRWDDGDLIRAARSQLDGGADVLICGHIHAPRHLRFFQGGGVRELIVLGDWDAGGEYALMEDGAFRLQRWAG